MPRQTVRSAALASWLGCQTSGAGQGTEKRPKGPVMTGRTRSMKLRRGFAAICATALLAVLWLGPARALSQPVAYRLPFPCGLEYKVTQGNLGKLSHGAGTKAAYAFDFNMAVGDAVVAAADGMVIRVKQDSNRGGFDEKYLNDANYVLIEHADGYRTLYLHLKHQSVVVKVGERVVQGQKIAESGATGYVTGPHLHFQLQQKGLGSWYEQSVPIQFSDVLGGVPEVGRTYASGNCHQAAPPQPASQASATVLVMDVSGSMGWSWHGGIKIDSARKAALQFIEQVVAAEAGNHMIGVVTFSSSARTVCELTFDYQKAKNTIISLGAAGATNLGGGLTNALSELNRAPPGRHAIILLSDGVSNTGLSRDQILAQPVAEARRRGICIYTVGFGNKGDIDEPFLRQVAEGSGCGTYNYAASGFELFGTYIKVRHSMLGSNRIVDYKSGPSPIRLLSGQSASLGAFQLTAPAQELHYTLAWSEPGRMRAILVDPSNREVTAGYPGATLYSGNGFTHITVASPKVGVWRVSAAALTSFTQGVQYYGVASARTGGIVIPYAMPSLPCVDVLGTKICIPMPDLPTALVVGIAVVAVAVVIYLQLVVR